MRRYALLAVLVVILAPARARASASLAPLERVAAGVETVLRLKVTAVREWSDERTLANGKKVFDAYYWEADCTVRETVCGKGPKVGSKLTLRRTMTSPIRYDEEGNVLVRAIIEHDDLGPEGGVRKGDTIVAGFGRPGPKWNGKFVVAARTLAEKDLPKLLAAMERAREGRWLIDAVAQALPEGWKIINGRTPGDATRFANPAVKDKGAIGFEIIAVDRRKQKTQPRRTPVLQLYAMPADYDKRKAMPNQPDYAKPLESVGRWLDRPIYLRTSHLTDDQAQALSKTILQAASIGERAARLEKDFRITVGRLARGESEAQSGAVLTNRSGIDDAQKGWSAHAVDQARARSVIADFLDQGVLAKASDVSSQEDRPKGPGLEVTLESGKRGDMPAMHLRCLLRDEKSRAALLKALQKAVGKPVLQDGQDQP